jgi:Membrane protein implicated in regulation of membrane protease activity
MNIVVGQLAFGLDSLALVLIAAGLIVGLAEALAPGAHLIVVGVALIAAGLVGLVLGPLASPLVLGGLVVGFGALAAYVYRELDLTGGPLIDQTRDVETLSGSLGKVTEAVTPEQGEIRLDGGGLNPYYSARTVHGTIAEGTEVIVTDPGGGTVVTVEAVDGGYDAIDAALAEADVERA